MPCNRVVKAKQFLRKLREIGVEVIEKRGKGSHVLLKYGDRTSTVPFHKSKDLDRNFLKEICKQLGLDPNEILWGTITMDLAYPATLSKLENGDIMARFRDVPEAITCGESREEVLKMAQDALTVALSAYLDDHRDIPKPSKPKRGQPLVELSPLVRLKLEIYQTMKDRKITVTELATRMNRDQSQVRRLLNLDHHSRMDQIETALLAIGKKLVVEAKDVA